MDLLRTWKPVIRAIWGHFHYVLTKLIKGYDICHLFQLLQINKERYNLLTKPAPNTFMFGTSNQYEFAEVILWA